MKLRVYNLKLLACLLCLPCSTPAAADTTLFGQASSRVFVSGAGAAQDDDLFSSTLGDLEASTSAENGTATSSTSVVISQTAVAGETLTTMFDLSGSINTVAAPSGTTATSSGLLNIRVDNPTTFDLSGAITLVSTNGTGSGQLFLRQHPPGPFVYINGNSGASTLIQSQATFVFSEAGSTGMLLPNVNYQLEWNWSVSRAFGRDPISGLGSFNLTLVEDISILVGDIDGDGFVGATDLDVLLADWGSTDSPADADGNGTVGQGDLDILTANWGSGEPPVGVVPEPGSLATLGLAGLTFMRRRRR